MKRSTKIMSSLVALAIFLTAAATMIFDLMIVNNKNSEYVFESYTKMYGGIEIVDGYFSKSGKTTTLDKNFEFNFDKSIVKEINKLKISKLDSRCLFFKHKTKNTKEGRVNFDYVLKWQIWSPHRPC